jgi:hypothetical protein
MPRPPKLDAAECLRLFDAGKSVAWIARLNRVTKQAVSLLLRAAGRDPAARIAAALSASDRAFRDAWESAADVGAAAKALGLSDRAAANKAAGFRRRGIALKRMPRRSTPGPASRS